MNPQLLTADELEMEQSFNDIESDLVDHGSSVVGTPISVFNYGSDEVYEHYDPNLANLQVSQDDEQDIKRRRIESADNSNPGYSYYSSNAHMIHTPRVYDNIRTNIESCPQIETIPPHEELSLNSEEPVKRKRGRPPGKKKIPDGQYPIFMNMGIPLRSFMNDDQISSSEEMMIGQMLPGFASPTTPQAKRGRGRPRKLPTPVQAPGEDWNSFSMRVAATYGPNYKPIDIQLNLPSDIAICDFIREMSVQSQRKGSNSEISLEKMKDMLENHFNVDISCRWNFLKEVYYLLYL